MHVVSTPLNAYLRYQFEWCYTYNVQAGQDVRILDLARTARGWVVQNRVGVLTLRGDDERLYRINTAGLDASALALLKEGRYVTVAVKQGVTAGAMPIAASVEEIDPSAAPGAPR